MDAVDVRGRFVWHQLLTRDVPGAKKFYPSLTGWNAQPWPMDPSHTVCYSGDLPTASLMPMVPEFPAEVPPHWMAYIGTRDVDGIAEAAVHAGGYIVKQPAALKGAGRYAVLADPQGAVFAIIDPENARAEPKGMPPAGQFSWHELATTDNEAAFAFYSNLFGWDAIRRMDIGPMGVYLIFGWDGEQKGGMYIKQSGEPSQASWLPYVRVPSVDAAASAIQAGGGKIVQGPMDVPGGSRIVMILDPAGAAFALQSNPDPAGASTETAAPASSAVAASASKPRAAKPKAKAKTKATTRTTPTRKKTARASTSRKAGKKVKASAKRPVKAKAKGKAKAKTKSKAATRPSKKVTRRKK